MNLSHLTDRSLLQDTKTLAKQERHLTLQILWHLQEIDRRKLYADLKYTSLWEFALQELGYSEGTAHRRITAARALSSMPELETKLLKGGLNLSAITSVMKEFKVEPLTKQREVFQAIENKTPQEVKAIIQNLAGKPKPKIQIEIDEETFQLLEELKALQPHKQDVLKSALVLAVDGARKQRFKTNLQLEVKSQVSARRTKREVFAQAKFQCQNCGTKRSLEIDHMKPRSLGGNDLITNLRVLCRNCNQRARIKAGLTSQGHKKLSAGP